MRTAIGRLFAICACLWLAGVGCGDDKQVPVAPSDPGASSLSTPDGVPETPSSSASENGPADTAVPPGGALDALTAGPDAEPLPPVTAAQPELPPVPPVAEPPVTPVPPAEPIVPEANEEVFPAPRSGQATARVNVRVGPATDKALLGTLSRGDEIRALGQAGKWLRIRVPERMPLWIGAQFVELPAGETFPAVGTLKGDKVRARSAGDLKAPILKELPRGTQVEVLGKTGDWLKIKAPADVTAWIYADYVELGGQLASGPASSGIGSGTRVPEPPRPPETGKTPETAKGPDVVKAPEEPTGTVELKGPGVGVFAEAEDAYRRAQAQEPPDYSEAYELYRRARAVKGLPAPVAAQCDRRLAEIGPKLTAEQAKQVDDKLVAERKEKIRALREEVIKIQTQIQSADRVFTAEGYLTQSPDVAGVPGPYKLSVSGVLMYYLKPAGPAVKLDRLVGRQVGVTGPKRFVPGWGTEVIDVFEAQQLGAGKSE